MKKLISLFLVTLICLAMVPMQAFSAENNEHVDNLKGCPHSGGYYYQTQVTYEEYDESYHYRVVVRKQYCSDCNELLSATVSDSTLIEHTFDYPNWSYLSSTHSGKYVTHYYTYCRKCLICDAAYTKKEKSRCTPYACIDPQ